MSTLRLLLLLIACAGPAFVYRLARPHFGIALSRRASRGLSGALVSTATVGIAMIAVGIPLDDGGDSLAASAMLATTALILCAAAWRQLPAENASRSRFITVKFLAPTVGCVACIMLAAFLVLPTGWRWL